MNVKNLGNQPIYGIFMMCKYTSWRNSQVARNCFKLCPRQALHAKTLGFVHPTTGEEMYFDSELPSDFVAMVDAWRRYSSASAAYLEE